MPAEVLWIEEEPRSLRYERKLAELHGCNITSVDTVEVAAELIRDRRFDIVVADLIMPPDRYSHKRGYVIAEAGIGFLELLRSKSRTGATPADVVAIVISAVVSPDKRKRAIQFLGDERYYLAKPVRKDAYLTVLKDAIASLRTQKKEETVSSDT